MTHTPTPWSVDQIDTMEAHILGAPSNFCADVIGTINTGFGTNDADRIVNCVNACAGLNPAAIPDVVEALKDFMFVMAKLGQEPENNPFVKRAEQALAKLQVQS